MTVLDGRCRIVRSGRGESADGRFKLWLGGLAISAQDRRAAGDRVINSDDDKPR
jgi:hypothetical protein